MLPRDAVVIHGEAVHPGARLPTDDQVLADADPPDVSPGLVQLDLERAHQALRRSIRLTRRRPPAVLR
ncbi:MAG: hypothetical protein R2726_19105 [Acidimicrobiales bacterium]